jgi:hypothetical protein
MRSRSRAAVRTGHGCASMSPQCCMGSARGWTTGRSCCSSSDAWTSRISLRRLTPACGPRARDRQRRRCLIRGISRRFSASRSLRPSPHRRRLARSESHPTRLRYQYECAQRGRQLLSAYRRRLRSAPRARPSRAATRAPASSAANRVAVSERMKKYWRERRRRER